MASGADVPYTRGAHQIADGVWAYLQPDGGWGRSNAGLIAGGDDATSLLVDTLFDLELTAEMLAALREATPAAERIATVVNTHANGDHCYGNALVAGADIVASEACAAEMARLPPAALADLMRAAPDMGETGAFLLDIFGAFRFDGVELIAPNRTFTGELELSIGDRPVHLIEVGPAHTDGDVIVHVPDAGVVFTGDIVFHGGHPIVWAGPVANWIAACDRPAATWRRHRRRSARRWTSPTRRRVGGRPTRRRRSGGLPWCRARRPPKPSPAMLLRVSCGRTSTCCAPSRSAKRWRRERPARSGRRSSRPGPRCVPTRCRDRALRAIGAR